MTVYCDAHITIRAKGGIDVHLQGGLAIERCKEISICRRPGLVYDVTPRKLKPDTWVPSR